MSRVISKQEYKRKRLSDPARAKDLIFCIAVLALPILNFFLFNFMQYVTMFKLAFTPAEEGMSIFSNFTRFFRKFAGDPNMLTGLKNSAIFYSLGWLMTPLALLSSYYIYLKRPGRKYFQLMQMLPGMVATMVWIMVYKYFMDLVLPDLLDWDMGLLTNANTKFLALVIYSVWFSLGSGLLIYTGMMGSVSEDVREAGRLDGMNRMQEFWHLMLPAIYSIFVINTVTGLIGFFTNQGNVFEFYGLDGPTNCYTIGYIMFQSVLGLSKDYGFNSAGSIIFTLIVAPLALLVKHLMFKYGPSED